MKEIRTEILIAATPDKIWKVFGDFGQFVNDRMDMEAKAPHQIKIQVDGKPMADLEIDFHHLGPYVVFPAPSQVAGK